MTTRTSIFDTKHLDLGDGLTVWTNRGDLRFHHDNSAAQSAYYKARSRFARKSLKDEGAEVFGAAVKNRAAAFEMILAGKGNGPQEWRWAIDRLRRMKEELHQQAIEAQRRAKAWYAERSQPVATAAD